MTAPQVSPLSDVDPRATLESDVRVGPFCRIGPDVSIAAGTRLISHVTLMGRVQLGRDNRIYPGVVIGGEPQDMSWKEGETSVVIGDGNIFREGVTVSRGAVKEDGITRIGHCNMFMANSHIAHNCHIFNHVILVNGVLLGGHVHVHDRAIVSGNSVVHHFSTLGTLSFVSGGCRVPHDIPPYMLAAGSDNPTVRTINIVGLRRRGISDNTISLLKRVHRLLYREHRPVSEVRGVLSEELSEGWPDELSTLIQFVENQHAGKMGRAREAVRTPSLASHTHRSPLRRDAA